LEPGEAGRANVKYQIGTAVSALLFVVVAELLAGDQRAAAVLGATIAGLTGLVSILALGRAVRSTRNPTRATLVVMGVLFGVRIVLVGTGTVLVGRAGAVAYVVSFFVPYFALAAFEGAYVHSLRRSGTTA
jgi:hypothetical protein